MHSRNNKPLRQRKKISFSEFNALRKPEYFSETQVIHSERQITNPDEIEFGVKYRVWGLTEYEEVAFESQFVDNNKVTWFLTKNGRRYSLADMGVISYSNKKWNSVGWLETLD